MKKKRAILSTGFFASQIKRGPIRSAANVADATALAKKDLEKLQEHYNTDQGAIISEGQPLFGGDTDPIFD